MDTRHRLEACATFRIGGNGVETVGKTQWEQGVSGGCKAGQSSHRQSRRRPDRQRLTRNQNLKHPIQNHEKRTHWQRCRKTCWRWQEGSYLRGKWCDSISQKATQRASRRRTARARRKRQSRRRGRSSRPRWNSQRQRTICADMALGSQVRRRPRSMRKARVSGSRKRSPSRAVKGAR